MTAYWHLRAQNIKEHNLQIKEKLELDTDFIKELTRGQMDIDCPDCREHVEWGNLR